ncbi:MAG: hypothetical protein JWP74_1196 [Marmoricola sp.]|nr:hypothetical protein [Marmoricola sp.]
MALTGRADGPPLAAPGRPASIVQDALDHLRTTTLERTGIAPVLPGIELFGERAAIVGFTRQGSVSCGGGFRLLPTTDGFLGLSLPRTSDLDLVPALVESSTVLDPWDAVARWATAQSTGAAVARCRLLGLAASGVPETPEARAAAVTDSGGRRARVSERPRVLDLTSLWAGPLATHLLQLGGADVVKVESAHRPDGARGGPAEFFDLLQAGKRMVALDFTTAEGRARLQALAADADLVVEASRPRALRQLGLVAEELVAAGTSWLSITARGRGSNDIGFGDDVAVGAGLVAYDGSGPVPCGDALADPLTGVVAAAAAADALADPFARLVDVSMEAVCASAAGAVEPHEVIQRPDGWEVVTDAGSFRVEPPTSRKPAGRAGALGADNATVLR